MAVLDSASELCQAVVGWAQLWGQQAGATHLSSTTLNTELHTVSQVAPSWCLHSSTCQFGNGTPKARNLLASFQVNSAAKNTVVFHIKICCDDGVEPVSLFGLTVGLSSTRPSLHVLTSLQSHAGHCPCHRRLATDIALTLTLTVTVTVVRLTLVTVIVDMRAYF